jgi:hypothetical protein
VPAAREVVRLQLVAVRAAQQHSSTQAGNPPVWAVQRPDAPMQQAIENRFTTENAKATGLHARKGGPGRRVGLRGEARAQRERRLVTGGGAIKRPPPSARAQRYNNGRSCG